MDRFIALHDGSSGFVPDLISILPTILVLGRWIFTVATLVPRTNELLHTCIASTIRRIADIVQGPAAYVKQGFRTDELRRIYSHTLTRGCGQQYSRCPDRINLQKQALLAVLVDRERPGTGTSTGRVQIKATSGSIYTSRYRLYDKENWDLPPHYRHWLDIA